ncbi:Uncharacterized protein SCF082_LOCUS35779 [Durusdinium trenchii]
MILAWSLDVRPSKRRKIEAQKAIGLKNGPDLNPAEPEIRPCLASARLSEELRHLARLGDLRLERHEELQARVVICQLCPRGEAVEIGLHCPERYPLVPPLLRHSNWRSSGLVAGWHYRGDELRLPRLQEDRWSFTMGLADVLADLLDSAGQL